MGRNDGRGNGALRQALLHLQFIKGPSAPGFTIYTKTSQRHAPDAATTQRTENTVLHCPAHTRARAHLRAPTTWEGLGDQYGCRKGMTTMGCGRARIQLSLRGGGRSRTGERRQGAPKKRQAGGEGTRTFHLSIFIFLFIRCFHSLKFFTFSSSHRSHMYIRR